jgi:hypothetical protein
MSVLHALGIRHVGATLFAAVFALACASPPPDYVSRLSEPERRVHGLLLAVHADEFADGLNDFVRTNTGDDARIREIFDPDDLLHDLTVDVSQSYDAKAVETLEGFFSSELGIRVSQALATPIGSTGRMGYALATGDTVDPAAQTERVSAIETLDEETRALETMRGVYLKTYESILESGTRTRERGLSAAQSRRWDVVDPESAMQGAGNQIDQVVDEHFLPLALYSFRDLSDTELQTFVELMASPAGRWFSGTTRDALFRAVDTRTGQMQPETVSRR